MSLDEIDNFVLLFPNAEWSNKATDDQLTPVVAQLSENVSYAASIDQNLRTLSTRNADVDGVISGFLYVPDLDTDDPCFNISKQYIPTNVTRQANLPPTDFTLIALAPWISSECSQSYMAAADGDPARAVIFYLADNGTDQPPSSSDPVWAINGGSSWTSSTQYPVYAIPGSVGSHMMHESSLYSGNMTQVPFGHEIAELPKIDPRDYVRIYTQLSVSLSSSLPSIWVLLLIIAAVLALMLVFISASMHAIQRMRRNALRRRVERGEVNLEALGIKRLAVPQETIDEMPIFTYVCEDPPLSPKFKKPNATVSFQHRPTSRGEFGKESGGQMMELGGSWRILPQNILDDNHSNPDSALTQSYLPESQPTCPICLDDFESGVTRIRELPCHHIFHPECIDPFMSENSSLCPMCKKSVLPKGKCPTKITNAMVNRERNVRRLRSRVTVDDEESDQPRDHDVKARIRSWGSSLKRVMLSSSTASHEDPPMTNAEQGVQIIMTNAIPLDHDVSLPNDGTEQDGNALSRQARAQQRIQELAARQPHIIDPDVMATRHQQSIWKRAWSKIFPGFA